jgi:hypothetical protein
MVVFGRTTAGKCGKCSRKKSRRRSGKSEPTHIQPLIRAFGDALENHVYLKDYRAA